MTSPLPVHRRVDLDRELTLPQACAVIEAEYPGWHVSISDAGKPRAVHHRCPDGQEGTVTAASLVMLPEAIAVAERKMARQPHSPVAEEIRQR